MDQTATLVSLCRPGSEDLLAAEITAAGGHNLTRDQSGGEGGSAGDGAGDDKPAPMLRGAGWMAWRMPAQRPTPLPGSLVFERQRLPAARFALAAPTAPHGALPPELPKRLVDAVLAAAGGGAHALVLHVFAADPGGETPLTRRAGWLERRLREQWPTAGAPPLGADSAPRLGSGTPVWQVCLVPDGLWWSLAPRAALVDDRPGGVHRMEGDPGAPSRSYLKIEEALDLFDPKPQPRERVIDLGAAPGGWSYAFLKRGCRVLAVDNGPLKLAGLADLPGELTHLREDGLRLRPPPGWLPADWLLSDMLIAPGVCLGLLRKWIEGGWMRHCIVNIKLPQREALVALRPVRDYLEGVPGLSWRMRQLYHDRREVTVMATLNAQPAAGGRAAARTARDGSTRKPQPGPRPRRDSAPAGAKPAPGRRPGPSTRRKPAHPKRRH